MVEGVRLHYVSAGAGPPVVLLHGNPGFVRDFAPGLVDSLALHFRVLALDRPGHGYSERPSGPLSHPGGQARLIQSALRELGVDRPVLVGHSWGGALALLYTLEYPEDVAGLVLLAPRAFSLGGRPDPLYTLLRVPLLGALIRHTFLPALGRRTLERRLGAAYAPDLPEPEHRAAARALWLRPRQVGATVWDSRNLNEQLRELSGRYSQVTVPVMILVGDADRPEREAVPLGRAIPGAELLVLPATGHQIPQTRPRSVLDAVERITKLCGSPSARQGFNFGERGLDVSGNRF
jgi:pimeloyl-ACP methyl ester carboxylesterase